MKQPSILDVVHGVKTVAPGHPDVRVWWYTPPQRLRLAGELPTSGPAEIALEVVLEAPSADALRCALIAKELSLALSGAKVGVRLHKGAAEERPLFRIVTRAERSNDSSGASAT